MRSAVLAAALEAFAPDLLIVDKLPSGVLGEFVPALERLRAAGRTKMVLGLRDVLDDPPRRAVNGASRMRSPRSNGSLRVVGLGERISSAS